MKKEIVNKKAPETIKTFKPEIKIVHFQNEDIIATSNEKKKHEKDIELDEI